MAFPDLNKNAAMVAGIYLAVTTAWIVGSDSLVEALAGRDYAAVQKWQTAKGIGFVVAMSGGLYLLVAWSGARERRHIEERQRMEEMLQASERIEALGTLAATVIHDFNNVITVIRGMAELAAMENYDPKKMPDRMKQIEQAIKRANLIVEQLSRFMRHAPQERQRGSLGAVVRGVEPLLSQAAGRRVSLHVEIADSLQPVNHDRGQIEQILLNLVINARDAMENQPEAHLVIGVSNQRLRDHVSDFRDTPTNGDFVVVSVADSGCGIVRDNFRRIFSPFFTTKPEGSGSGLGLASVQRLMQQHQGWVELESAPGKGTTFRLYFPVAGKVAQAA